MQAQTTEQGHGVGFVHPGDALATPSPGGAQPTRTQLLSWHSGSSSSSSPAPGAGSARWGRPRSSARSRAELCRARPGSRAAGGSALPSRAGDALAPPPRAGRTGHALARGIKGGEQRSGGEHLSLPSGTSPDAFIRCRLSGELQLPTVSSVKLPHKAARGLEHGGARGAGGGPGGGGPRCQPPAPGGAARGLCSPEGTGVPQRPPNN